MDKLIIDGIEVEPQPERTVLEVAQELGIRIPTLCAHKSLAPYGACRICSVETIWKGKSSFHTACTYPAWEGEVRTNSESVRRLRRTILELMLAEAPDAEEVRELAREYGADESRFRERERENKKCIMCGLCVRICRDVMGFEAIGFRDRGHRREISTPLREPSDVCSTCGACAFVCPTGAIELRLFTDRAATPIRSEFERDLTTRPCVYTPFAQAVPNVPVIDREHCVHFMTGGCGVCEDVCQPDAIRFDQEDEIVEEEVGAIVAATGFELYPIANLGEYGAGKFENVIDGLQFERLLSASGPTQGEVRRPSDGTVPKEIVFLTCAGSRDPESHLPYCSKICCMYLAKHAMLYKHKVPDGQPYIFYMDIRAGGKAYEEFVQRAVEEDDVLYLRGRVSKMFEEDGKVVIWGADTLTGQKIELKADLVVLGLAMVPNPDAADIASKLKLQTDEWGFLSEAHPKLRPVESIAPGFYLAGAAQAPKDIPEVVAQASGAASKVAALFAEEEYLREPTIASVDEDLCGACRVCISVCPYDAAEFDEEKKVAHIKEAVCEGCGACVAACPSGAAAQRNFTDEQLYRMVSAVLED